MMSVNTICSRLLKAYRNFIASRDGNVAVIFAITLIPVVGMVGAAVDFSHANSVKVAMQSALDATVLKLSKEAGTDTPAQLQTNATSYFQAVFNRPEAQNVTVTAAYTTSGGTHITLNGSAAVPTYFMGLMGFNSMTVTDTAAATWGTTRLLAALVLDNTGSMAQSGKIAAEQTASKNLLTQLQSAAHSDGDVYVSVIPFVDAVNVGASNYTASWLTWADYGTCSRGGGTNITQQLCKLGGGSWTTYPTSRQSSWTGCVLDRGDVTGPDVGNYDTNAAPPTLGNAATQFAAVQYSSCPQQSMGLSYNWSTMTTLINNMTPSGVTNQNIGLAIGWMSLVGGGPYTVPSLDPNYTYKKAIILLTDGLNNTDRWYNTQSPVDARQTLTCKNIQAAGITIYTVQVSTDGTPRSTLLETCASDSSKYFYLTSATEIISTFSSIGTDLSNLYLSQ